MPATDVELRAFDALSANTRLPDLVTVVATAVSHWVESRQRHLELSDIVSGQAAAAGLTRADADTPCGNALAVLERGPEDDAERALCAAMYAHVLAARKPVEGESLDRIAADILWLAANTPFDPLGLLDRAAPEWANVLWPALADRVRRLDEGKLPSGTVGEALVALAALASSSSVGAAKAIADLAPRLRSPRLKVVLAAGGGSGTEERLTGELVGTPRGSVATVLLALTGILLVGRGLALFARVALGYRKPAEVLVSGDTIKIRSKTQLLGKTLRDSESVLVRAGLTRATREVRYPRLALYAGLLALAAGSYLGVSLFVDGARSGSVSLVATGLLLVALGVCIDFVMVSLLPGTRGRCHLLFVPRKGGAVCVSEVSTASADSILAKLARA